MDLQFFSFAVGTGTSSVHGKSTTLPCVPRVRLRVLDEHWFGNSLLRVCMSSFCTSLSSAVCHVRANITGLPDTMISCVKRALFRQSASRTPLRVHTHSWWTITTGFTENEVHIGVFSECVTVRFKHAVTTRLRHSKNSAYNSLQIERLKSHASVCGHVTITVHVTVVFSFTE